VASVIELDELLPKIPRSSRGSSVRRLCAHLLDPRKGEVSIGYASHPSHPPKLGVHEGLSGSSCAPSSRW
jgi:hypothetical protein